MTSARGKLILIPLMLIIVIFSAGCLETSFGVVEYSYPLLNIEITNSGEETDAYVQVTVFDLADFRQIEIGKYVEDIHLKTGSNMVSVPVKLKKGDYKLYIYLIENNERKVAEIRDIGVE